MPRSPAARLRVETLEDRTTPAITVSLSGGLLRFDFDAANDSLTVGGFDPSAQFVFYTANGISQFNISVTSIEIRDTSNGGAGGADGQSVVFQDQPIGRLALSGSITVTGIENVTFSNPTSPVSTGGPFTITGARTVSQTNTIPQIQPASSLRISASGAGDAIGTAANPLRVAAGASSLSADTTAGNGNQFYDFGNLAVLVNGGSVGPVTAGTGTVSLTNGFFIGTGADDFGNNTEFHLGTGSALSVANDEAIGSLSGSGIVGAARAGTHTIVLGGGDRSSGVPFAGVLQDLAGVLAVRKIGSGTISLAGANTYTGTTTVNAGTLQVVNKPVPTGSPISIAGGAALDYNVTTGTVTQGATTITGTGVLRKTGAGVLTFGGLGNVNWQLGAGGLIDVLGGTLNGGNFQQDFWTNNLSGLNVAVGATFDGIEANVRVDAITGAGTIRSGFPSSGYVAFTFGVNNGSSTFGGVLGNSNNVPGTPANFSKAGSGTIILTGINTYTGTTTINDGTLVLENPTDNVYTYTGGTVSINGASTLRIRTTNAGPTKRYDFPSTAFVFGAAGGGTIDIPDAGSNILFQINNSITTTGGARNTITGLNGFNIGGNTTVFNIARGNDLTSDLTVSAPLFNSGSVTKLGAGILTFTGANTYTGTTTINAGALQVGNGGTTGTLGTGAVTNGGSLIFNRSNTLVVPNTFSTALGTLSQVGTGTTVLNGPIGSGFLNTSVFATAGTLLLNGAVSLFAAGGQPGVVVNGANVNNPTFLGGTGTINRPVQAQNGGVIGPGSATATGTLNTAGVSFLAGGAFGVKVAGGAAGQFDALNVTGPVNLTNGAIFVVPTAAPPAVGTVLTVIANDGADPVVGTFAGQGEGSTVLDGNGNPYTISYVGGDGNDVTLTVPAVAPPPPPPGRLIGPLLVSGPAGGIATLYAPTGGGGYGGATAVNLLPGFGGEVHVALGDVTGDGVPDQIGGAGPGGSRVRVLDGATGGVLADFTAFPGYAGGVFVAAGDLNGDGLADLAVTGDAVDAFSGPQSNTLQVRVFNGASLRNGTGSPGVLADFDGLASLNGASGQNNPLVKLGGRPAIADLNGDGRNDLLIAAGSGGGPRVTVWNGTGFAAANGGKPTTNPIANLFVFESTQRGGAFVTAGDVNSDGRAEIAVGGGPGGGPRVRVVNAAILLGLPNLEAVNLDDPTNLGNGLVLNNFFAGDGNNRGGVRVAVRDADGDGRADVVVGSGTNEPSAVRVYAATALAAVAGTSATPPEQGFNPFGGVVPGGVWVG